MFNWRSLLGPSISNPAEAEYDTLIGTLTQTYPGFDRFLDKSRTWRRPPYLGPRSLSDLLRKFRGQ